MCSVLVEFLVYTCMLVSIITSILPNCEICEYGNGCRCTSVIRHHSGMPMTNSIKAYTAADKFRKSSVR